MIGVKRLPPATARQDKARLGRSKSTCVSHNRRPVVFAINENENGMETNPERLQTASPTDSAPVRRGGAHA